MEQPFTKLNVEKRRVGSGTQAHNFFTAQIEGSGNRPVATKQFQGEAQIKSSDNILSNDTVPTRRVQFVDTGNKRTTQLSHNTEKGTFGVKVQTHTKPSLDCTSASSTPIYLTQARTGPSAHRPWALLRSMPGTYEDCRIHDYLNLERNTLEHHVLRHNFAVSYSVF